MRPLPYPLLLALLGALVALLICASLLIGPAAIGLGESLHALLEGRGEAVTLVMREIRLPRALLGAAVGGALGLAGAMMQGLLRNPLAEPGLIGTSASAALGAVLALQSGLAAAFVTSFATAAVELSATLVLVTRDVDAPLGAAAAAPTPARPRLALAVAAAVRPREALHLPLDGEHAGVEVDGPGGDAQPLALTQPGQERDGRVHEVRVAGALEVG